MDKNHQVSKLLVGKSQVSNNSNGKKSSGQTFTGKKKYMVKSKKSGQNQVITVSGQESSGQ